MSINPETDLNLDELFQPSWAKEADSKNIYAKYEPRERRDRDDRRGRDRFRRGPQAEGRPPRGDRRPRGKGGPRTRPRPERRDPPPPPPEIAVSIHAEQHGAESLARQIKTTGRAYPLFDIARMILQKPARYCAHFAVKRGPDGNILQPLFTCVLDQSLWLSEDDAVQHVLRQHLATFYQAERTETEPPKGTYTFVAQCGMSGTILGPPNHHDYQTKLRELHSKRFAHMPFEMYKSRVKIVRDEAVVKQWVDDQSWKTEYICLNVPEEERLPDMAAVETHFRKTHLPTIITQTELHTLPGEALQSLRGPVYRAYREVFEQQRRFPMQVATSLSQQFASQGLQFFKVNKSVTHVWVARPTFLDLDSEPVSDSVRKIVEYVNAHPKCTRRQLIESLAPSPAAPAAPAAPATPEGPEAGAPADSAAVTEEVQPTEKPAQAEAAEPTPEQAALIADLHWLIHQGHVIEFANGLMETAKKPAPRPPQTPSKKKSKAKPSESSKAEQKAETKADAEGEDAATPAAEPKPTESTDAPSAPPAPEPSAAPAPEQPPAPAMDPKPDQAAAPASAPPPAKPPGDAAS